MDWWLSWRADPQSALIADRHYSRQSIGSVQFVPPGRCIVLRAMTVNGAGGALCVSSWPYRQFVRHAWVGAWMCSLFRNEGGVGLSSTLIRDAVSATRWRWPDVPAEGMVTFVDASKVRPKQDPGYCFLCAGFERVGTTAGGLLAFRLSRDAMPEATQPLGAPSPMF